MCAVGMRKTANFHVRFLSFSLIIFFFIRRWCGSIAYHRRSWTGNYLQKWKSTSWALLYLQHGFVWMVPWCHALSKLIQPTKNLTCATCRAISTHGYAYSRCSTLSTHSLHIEARSLTTNTKKKHHWKFVTFPACDTGTTTRHKTHDTTYTQTHIDNNHRSMQIRNHCCFHKQTQLQNPILTDKPCRKAFKITLRTSTTTSLLRSNSNRKKSISF